MIITNQIIIVINWLPVFFYIYELIDLFWIN